MRIVGVDVGGTYIKAGLVNVGTNLRVRPDIGADTWVCPYPVVEAFKSVPTSPQNIVQQIVGIVAKLKPEALGVGIAGLVANGIVYSSPNLPSIGKLKLKAELKSRLHIPVEVANDTNMVVLGEWKYGAGRGAHNLLLLTLGTGVGGGIIINDKLYTGTGFAAEVGHITLEPNGLLCGCGNRGCLETLVGSKYLSKKAFNGIKSGTKTTLSGCHDITPEIISKEAYKGDKFAASIIENAGHWLGIGVASICAVLDPDRVIIGGGISKAGELLFKPIREEVKKRLYSRKDIEILSPELGDRAGILGSILLVKW